MLITVENGLRSLVPLLHREILPFLIRWKDKEQVKFSQRTESVAVFWLTKKFTFLQKELVNK